MGEPLEEIEDAVQEHGRDSRYHGRIAAFVAVALSGVAALTGRRWLFGPGGGDSCAHPGRPGPDNDTIYP